MRRGLLTSFVRWSVVSTTNAADRPVQFILFSWTWLICVRVERIRATSTVAVGISPRRRETAVDDQLNVSPSWLREWNLWVIIDRGRRRCFIEDRLTRWRVLRNRRVSEPGRSNNFTRNLLPFTVSNLDSNYVQMCGKIRCDVKLSCKVVQLKHQEAWPVGINGSFRTSLWRCVSCYKYERCAFGNVLAIQKDRHGDEVHTTVQILWRTSNWMNISVDLTWSMNKRCCDIELSVN